MELAGYPRTINEGFSAPFAVAQAFREIYIASITVHG
jgi:hypothetical protein